MSSRCYLHWHSLSLEPIFQKGVFFFLWGRGKSQIGFCLPCLRFLYKFTMVFLSLQGDSIYIYPTIAKRVHSVTLKFEKRGTSSSFDIYIFCFVKNSPQVPFILVLRTSIKKKMLLEKYPSIAWRASSSRIYRITTKITYGPIMNRLTKVSRGWGGEQSPHKAVVEQWLLRVWLYFVTIRVSCFYKVFRLPKTLFIQCVCFYCTGSLFRQPIASLYNRNKHLGWIMFWEVETPYRRLTASVQKYCHFQSISVIGIGGCLVLMFWVVQCKIIYALTRLMC